MKLVPQKVTRTIGRQKLKLSKNAPHIAFSIGVVGMVSSTVLACRATLKLEDTLQEIEEDLSNAKHGDELEGKALTGVYIRSGSKLARLYGPSVGLGVASLTLLTSSHVALTRRNAALTMAYATLEKGFSEYRDRVREELGEEKEANLYHGVTEETVKGEGNKKETIKTVTPGQLSPYAKLFDEYNPNWKPNGELNKIFLMAREKYANHLLQSRGHIFLNEIYDSLGLDRTKAGQVVGWVISEEGDNYIDFGLFDVRNRDFVNGPEMSIYLDFNVDGVIVDKI